MTTFITQQGKVNLDGVPEAAKTVAGQQMPTSQSTLLLQKKKEMAEVQEELDRKKDEVRERMRKCQQKEEELARKQEQIREQVVKFEKFLKENDGKRLRAYKKAQEEKKLCQDKQLEIEDLKRQIEEYQVRKNEIRVTTEKSTRYEMFLESVLDLEDDFQEIVDVKMRYDTLKATHEGLLKHNRDCNTDMEAERARMTNYMKESQNQILVYNSILAEKQKYLETLRLDVAHQELQKQKREDADLERTRQLGEIRMAIENIYQRSRVRRPVESTSPMELLNAIEERMVDYHDICSIVKNKISEQTKGQAPVASRPPPKAEKAKERPTATKPVHKKEDIPSYPPSSRATSR
eukprot:Rmarinus@m.21104